MQLVQTLQKSFENPSQQHLEEQRQITLAPVLAVPRVGDETEKSNGPLIQKRVSPQSVHTIKLHQDTTRLWTK